jgi:hypothetical protein
MPADLTDADLDAIAKLLRETDRRRPLPAARDRAI